MGIPFSPSLPNVSFILLRLYRNHSAFNSHNFPRTCTTTYLFSMLLYFSNHYAPTRGALRFGTYLVASGCTYGLVTVSFHSFCIEVSFDAVSAQSFARPLAGLLATHLAIVYSIYSAYLPGLHAARPSAFVEGEGFEPPPNPSSVMRCFQPLSQPSLSRTLRFCRKDNHLNTFKSSYIPLAIFSAISC